MILLFLLLATAATTVVSLLARTRPVMERANLAGFATTFAIAVALAAAVLRRGPVSLWNGFLYADDLSALVILLTSSVALLCSCYAVGYMRNDECTVSKLREYYVLTPLFVFSMLLIAVANNLGVMWVAIEATTLASVFLVTFYEKKTSLEAAWKYAMIGSVGLSMALFGTILTFYSDHHPGTAASLASLNWSQLVLHAPHLDKATMRLAFALILLGYGTKAGLAPMHTWKPDAYAEAPPPSGAILSTATLNCALYGLTRFYILTSHCTGPEYPGRLLLIFGILSMGVSVPFVLVQKNLRRLLAYHTIDHAGIMATALGIGGPLGSLALMLHMTFHTIAKSLLFLCAGNVYHYFKTDMFHRIKGSVMRAMPLTGVIFLMAMLAIIGMPPFSLFQSEFLIVQAAFLGGHTVPGVLFVLFGTGVFAGALMHVGSLVLGPAGDGVAGRRPWRDNTLLALAAALVAIAFWLPAPLLELIRGAAKIVGGP